VTSKTIITCNRCGGSDILKDAYAEWDGEAWVLHSVYDSTTCDTCGVETSVTEIEETTDVQQ